ncbi:helix-turn-helix domain-containing protein [Actinophytocola oryzae]|uniref:Helix-turn-helix protein n=1 Tax=Actinophytocola oryzae TaxID=502181 RepID=A0A4R7UX63_9PSEU|nr:helix-turn-helix transcriptional regulator [Actinophytocola oryzae]TDV41418.1 helix-turn-helix protein [Actinophytocola oryzae]
MTMMLSASDSTVRVEVLGEELRRLRDACGLTLAEVVSRIGISESYLSRMEKGKRVPSPEDVSALLVVYGVKGDQRLELLTLAKRSNQPGFWQRDTSAETRFATLKLLESRATSLVSFEPLIVPGLLQTMPYARSMVEQVCMVTEPKEIDNWVIGRVHRQGVLRKIDAPQLTAILAESALRNFVGGREVMRDQLRYLTEITKRANVTLRIVPTMIGGHPGLLGSFLRMRFADRPNVVFFENQTSSLFLEEHSDTAAYDQAINQLLDLAISEADSVRLVTEMAATLE